MNYNDVVELISSVGFPIFVAVFMMIKNSNDTKTLTDTVNELKNAISKLTELINKKG